MVSADCESEPANSEADLLSRGWVLAHASGDRSGVSYLYLRSDGRWVRGVGTTTSAAVRAAWRSAVRQELVPGVRVSLFSASGENLTQVAASLRELSLEPVVVIDGGTAAVAAALAETLSAADELAHGLEVLDDAILNRERVRSIQPEDRGQFFDADELARAALVPEAESNVRRCRAEVQRLRRRFQFKRQADVQSAARRLRECGG